MKLIDQLDEEKVDSLINVVKGMAYPSTHVVALHEKKSTSRSSSVREVNNDQYIITQHINDSFN